MHCCVRACNSVGAIADVSGRSVTAICSVDSGRNERQQRQPRSPADQRNTGVGLYQLARLFLLESVRTGRLLATKYK